MKRPLGLARREMWDGMRGRQSIIPNSIIKIIFCGVSGDPVAGKAAPVDETRQLHAGRQRITRGKALPGHGEVEDGDGNRRCANARTDDL